MSHSRLRHFQKHRLFWRMNTLLVLLLPSVLLAEEAPISTPLLDAIYHNDTAEVLILLEAGADPHETNRFQAQPIQYACLNGNLEILQALLEAGANPDSMGEGRIRPLMLAAKNGHPALVRALLEAGVDPTDRDGEGQTAILFACHEGHLEAVQLLHQAGADPFDRIAKGKFDGFLLAARNGHTHVVAYLLNEAEGDPNHGIEVGGDGRAPKKGTSIMRLAMENGHFDTAALLLQAGADPRDDADGFTALHALTWIRKSARGDTLTSLPPPKPTGTLSSLDFAKLLLDAGADVDAQLGTRAKRSGSKGLRYEGSTPFLIASRTADLPYMKFLIEEGANPTLANAGGQTPLLACVGVDLGPESDEEATLPETYDAVAYLLRLGADVHAVDKRKNTVMHAAAHKQSPNLVHLLAQHGAQVEAWNVPNGRGNTPLRISRGYRPGNFKPSAPTEAALTEVMLAAGITPPPAPSREEQKPTKGYPADP